MSAQFHVRFAASWILALTLWGVPKPVSARGTPSAIKPADNSEDVQKELSRINNDLQEIRRDQLNYKIERDLLKETYTTSLQTINVVLAIILGAFAILGYLGLRSLGALRGFFQRELEQFRAAKFDLDAQLKTLGREQSEAKAQVDKLKTQNEEQDKRLRAFEIREKAQAQMSGGYFGPALDYLGVGLELLPNDPIMMRQKAQCLSGLGRLSEAISALETVVQKTPNDTPPIVDLAEFYALNGQFDDHDRLVGRHRDVVERRSPFSTMVL